jgi:hypothetical protein
VGESFRAAGIILKRMKLLVTELKQEIENLEETTRRVDRVGEISLVVSILALVVAIIALYISVWFW